MPQPRHAQRLPARFRPLRPASRAKLHLGVLVGAATWVLALLALALVVSRRDAVELALAILAASFAVGFLASGWMRIVRVREERRR